jgi:hypothetical protein
LRAAEQKELAAWAKRENLIYDSNWFFGEWKEQGELGETESQIWFDEDKGVWWKANDLSYHGTYLEFFYRVALHNHQFPEAPLTLRGFVVGGNLIGQLMLKPVFTQPHVVGQRGATQQEVERHMAEQGFRRMPGTEFDYFNPETGVRVEDLHDENVLVDEQGDLFVIDPVLYLDDDGKSHRIKALEFESADAIVAKLLNG